MQLDILALRDSTLLTFYLSNTSFNISNGPVDIYLGRKLLFPSRDKIKYILFSWETDLRASCVPARRRRASPRSIPRLSGADLGSLTPETASEPSKYIDDRCAAAAASRAPGKSVSGAGFAAYRHVYLPDVLLVGYLRRVDLHA